MCILCPLSDFYKKYFPCNPDRDPAKLIDAAAQISESGIPLEKLEEHVNALKSEKETLQREIDEKRAMYVLCHM